MFDDFFYNRLTQLRLQKGVSARDMSLALGQGAGYINNIENRKNLPSMTVFFYICEYFNITPKDFFDDGSNYPQKTQELIHDIQALTPTQLENIMSIIKDLKKN